MIVKEEPDNLNPLTLALLKNQWSVAGLFSQVLPNEVFRREFKQLSMENGQGNNNCNIFMESIWYKEFASKYPKYNEMVEKLQSSSIIQFRRRCHSGSHINHDLSNWVDEGLMGTKLCPLLNTGDKCLPIQKAMGEQKCLNSCQR